MAKKESIYTGWGFEEVWTGRGAASKVKSEVRLGKKLIPGTKWAAMSGSREVWNPKKGIGPSSN